MAAKDGIHNVYHGKSTIDFHGVTAGRVREGNVRGAEPGPPPKAEPPQAPAAQPEDPVQEGDASTSV